MPDQSIAYKCPSCNAPLAFDTVTQSFSCDYCGGRFDKNEIEAMTAKAMEILPGELEEPEAEAVWEHNRDEKNEKIFAKDNNLYICPTCGAEVMTDSELSASAFCHYCHSPVVLSGRLSEIGRAHV